ncbi:hypothetical protein [Kribbella sp. NPDC023855]|uniref:hypothetical protein n=1 Tax=Kribbella sp. NPDC023855 TaxID=3154698 RepID=UPI00340A3EFD
MSENVTEEPSDAAEPVATEVPQPGAPTEEELAADKNLWSGQEADDTPAEIGDDTGVDGDEQADEFVGED